MNAAFARAILLKVGFKPEALKRAQGFFIYAALAGHTFTGDILPAEIATDNTTAGCAVGALRTQKLIEFVGRVKSPSRSRNGAWTNVWQLAPGRRAAAQLWLERNGFPAIETRAVQQTLAI